METSAEQEEPLAVVLRGNGNNGGNGWVAAACFAADETLTMMARKPGLAAVECGLVRVAPLAYLEPFLG